MARGHPDYLVTAGKTGDADVKVDFDFLVNNGTRKLLSDTAIGETITLYTVPAGKKLYVTSMLLDFSNDDSVIRDAQILINDVRVINVIAPASTGINSNIMIFELPILVAAGETIKIVNSFSAGGGEGTVQGYELDV